MDPEEADRIVDRHHQMVVGSIKAGAVDGDLLAIREAEHRRTPPREPVLIAIQERIDALEELHDNG